MAGKWQNNVMTVLESKTSPDVTDNIRSEINVYLDSGDDNAENLVKNIINIIDTQRNLYIRLEEDVNLAKGQNLIMQNKQASLDKSLKDQKITEDRHIELSEKLHFIKYEVSVPPADS